MACRMLTRERSVSHSPYVYFVIDLGCNGGAPEIEEGRRGREIAMEGLSIG
jgi:hypothetical protein